MSFVKRAAFLAAFFFISFGQTASASCGAATCSADIQTAEKTDAGWVRLDYTVEYIDQDQPRISRRKASPGEITGHHDELYTLNQIQKFGLEAGLSSRLSIQLILPFIHREHQHIHHHHGSDIRDEWNFDGMGDLTILSHFAVKGGGYHRTRLSIIAGGVVPTGRTDIINDQGSEAEAGLRPGQGAYGLIMGASLFRKFKGATLNGRQAELPVFFSSTYQWNEPGEEEYRIGNLWVANAGLVYPLFPKAGFMIQTNLKVHRRDDKGQTSEEVQKTGGEFVYLSPGLQFTLSPALQAFFMVQIPVYQRVNVIQVTSDQNVLAGVSYRFSVL